VMVRVVVVAHRETMVAEGISAALARFPWIVPGGATTAASEVERLGARAHAVAIEAELPGAGVAADRLRRGGVRVVFLGEANGEDDVRVPTSAPVRALAAALAPGEGRSMVDHSGPLTSRESEILRLAARGLSGRQVARQLGISPKTVERHKTRIFAKLGVPNQTAAVSALRDGMGREERWNRSIT
jgi:DNA-binding CsgD family transcriptional regulator